jgi:hypothetical protein
MKTTSRSKVVLAGALLLLVQLAAGCATMGALGDAAQRVNQDMKDRNGDDYLQKLKNAAK